MPQYHKATVNHVKWTVNVTLSDIWESCHHLIDDDITDKWPTSSDEIFSSQNTCVSVTQKQQKKYVKNARVKRPIKTNTDKHNGDFKQFFL